MNPATKVIQVGLGPIGLEMAKRAAARPDLELVGAVDIDPTLTGRSLEEVLGGGVRAPGQVLATVAEAVEAFGPQVALLTTTSDLSGVESLVVDLLERGVSIVSTCEEMLYPFNTQPETAARIDEAGKRGGAACLGTGINPGFVLDFLPILLTGPVERLRSVKASRIVDAALRRGPLQKKVGAGLTEAGFQARVEAGGFGHRGMVETLHLVCAAFDVDTVGGTTFIRPVISERSVKTEHVSVEPGQVAGIHQGAEDREGIVMLDLKMYVGAEDPGDRVEIEAEPSVKVQVEGGYHGDVATCAITLNAVASVRSASPGFRTMLDVIPPRALR